MDEAAVAGPRRPAPAPAAADRRLLWLVVGSLAAIATATVVMRLTGFAGWDTPAHLYKVAVLRRGGSVLWDNEWYGGAYQLVGYGFVFYWLAQFVSCSVLVVVSAGVLPVLFYAYMRRVYDVTSLVPAVSLAAVLVVYLANGQDPFLFALALTMAGLVAEAWDRRVAAACLVGVACFANPVAVTIGAVFLAAQYVSRPRRRAGLRRLGLLLLPFVGARLVLALFFWESASYFYRPVEVFVYVLFGVVGALGARFSSDPQSTAKQTLFLTFAAVSIAAAALPANPMGGTFGRFFFVFGVPLLLTLRGVRLPRAALVLIVAGVALGQLIVPAMHFVSRAQGVSARPSFFAPALAFAASHHDPDFRFHVVALANHWEAYYFPLDDFAITRGWYRQSDALHNGLLYEQHFSAAQYVAWLRRMGVRYVFLPAAPLDLSGARESLILATDPRFRPVFRDSEWTIFELRGASPLVVARHGYGSAHVVALDRESVTLSVAAPGSYLVKVSYSPYWRVALGDATLQPSRHDFIVMHAAAPGEIALRMSVTPHALWDELVTQLR